MPVDLDSAIDTVGREMTAFEPSGAMRARVLERIEQGRRSPSHLVPRWAWAGVAAAVALAAATTIWVTSPAPSPGRTQMTAAEATSGGPAAAVPGSGRPAAQPVAGIAEAAPPKGLSAAAARTIRPAAVRGARAAEVETADGANRVPALAAIEPLRFTAVGPDPLHFADVEVTPITEMPAIDIPSLDSNSNDIQSADPKKEK